MTKLQIILHLRLKPRQDNALFARKGLLVLMHMPLTLSSMNRQRTVLLYSLRLIPSTNLGSR